MAPRPARGGPAPRRASAWITATSAILLLVIASAVVLGGCGGGGTTTVIEKGDTATTPSQPPAKPALLKLPTYEHELVEPSTYSFVVDGSFVGAHLKWEGWGTQTATGTGIIEERD